MNYRRVFLGNGEYFAGCAGLEGVENYAEWLDFENRLSKKYGDGYAPSTVLLALRTEDETLAGILEIRHRLTPFLLRRGGHIGYSVLPSQRRRGCATEMLRLALKECRKLNLDRVLLTCDKGNVASARDRRQRRRAGKRDRRRRRHGALGDDPALLDRRRVTPVRREGGRPCSTIYAPPARKTSARSSAFTKTSVARKNSTNRGSTSTSACFLLRRPERARRRRKVLPWLEGRQPCHFFMKLFLFNRRPSRFSRQSIAFYLAVAEADSAVATSRREFSLRHQQFDCRNFLKYAMIKA